jgi:hypothetical protein
LSFRLNLMILEFTPEWSREWHSPEWVGTEFLWNSVRIPFLYLVYLATKHSHSILPTHHQPCSSPPPAFVPAHDGLKTLPHRHQSPPLTSITHAHNYHHSKNNMAAPRHQVNEHRPHQRDQHVGGSRRTTMMLSFIVLVYIINEGEYLVDLPQNGQYFTLPGVFHMEWVDSMDSRWNGPWIPCGMVHLPWIPYGMGQFHGLHMDSMNHSIWNPWNIHRFIWNPWKVDGI